MSNHVRNRLVVFGNKSTLRQFENQARSYDPDYHAREDEVDAESPERRRRLISFWNFIRPDRSIFKTYFAPAGGDMTKNPNNWYRWNYNNWGTKWDAYDESLTNRQTAGIPNLMYRFTTANNAPLPVLEKMMELYPTLEFRLDYEDETGNGARVTSRPGGLWVTETSFGPAKSHTDAVRAERLYPCRCENEDYAAFDDCPSEL